MTRGMLVPWMTRTLRCPAAVIGMLMSLGAVAADDLDVTMRMVTDDAELTNSVIREIELPMMAPSEMPKAKSEVGAGFDTANDARNGGRELGQSMADGARRTKGRSDMMQEKPELPVKPEGSARPERPEPPDSVRDRAQQIKDKAPPGLER